RRRLRPGQRYVGFPVGVVRTEMIPKPAGEAGRYLSKGEHRSWANANQAALLRGHGTPAFECFDHSHVATMGQNPFLTGEPEEWEGAFVSRGSAWHWDLGHVAV
ncbi:MAG TPA: hypothetical protein VK845_11995, partial [Gemmatimonadales bacterium]|nr:hypothetical protein [Gemmatimonadales bacterium]